MTAKAASRIERREKPSLLPLQVQGKHDAPVKL
jgi:hypothetical protein